MTLAQLWLKSLEASRRKVTLAQPGISLGASDSTICLSLGDFQVGVTIKWGAGPIYTPSGGQRPEA